MARMIPSAVHVGTKSDGEKAVFTRIKEDPNAEDWTALHSYDLPEHAVRYMGEIDFVVLIPTLGILCLSIKDCKSVIRTEMGTWHVGSISSAEGPFKAAREDMFSLRDRLIEAHPHLSDVPFGFAVLFTRAIPRQELRREPTEWKEHEQIFADAFNRRAVSALLRDSLQASVEELRQHRYCSALTPEKMTEIVQFLRPQIEFYQPPKERARETQAELKRYTQEQYDALDTAEENDRVFYTGLAGAGKTLLALEAARRQSDKGRRVLFLCFNSLLRAWLVEQAGDSLKNVDIRTLHGHMQYLANAKPPAQPDSAYFDSLLPKALERLMEENEKFLYDTLVIDEAQDVLKGPYFDLLDWSLVGGLLKGRWLMFGDIGQDIFGAHPAAGAGERSEDLVDIVAFCKEKGVDAYRHPLRRNCRNTPRVGHYAQVLGRLAPGYSGFRREDDHSNPTLRFYENEDEQRTFLIEALENAYIQHFESGEIVVLSAKSAPRSCAVTIAEPPWKDRLRPLENASGGVRYGSVYRFKGLEAPFIIVTDIEGLGQADRASLLYVAITRAVNRLVVLAHKSVQAEIRALLMEKPGGAK